MCRINPADLSDVIAAAFRISGDRAAERPIPNAVVSNPPPSGDRLESLDAIRCLAALGIIWVHAIDSTALADFKVLGRFGVPFYLCAAVLLLMRSFRRDPQKRIDLYLGVRAQRLLIPFLAWNFLFLGMRAAAPGGSALEIHPYLLLSGSLIHLWFLPFLFMVTVVATIVAKASVGSIRRRILLSLMFASLSVLLMLHTRPTWMDLTGPEGFFFAQAWKSLPEATMALAVALIVPWKVTSRRWLVLMGIVGTVLLVGAMSQQYLEGENRAMRSLSGVGLLMLAFAPLPRSAGTIASLVGRHAFGIYLTHQFFIEVLRFAAYRSGVTPSAGFDVFTFMFTVVGSVLLTVTLARFCSTAWLVGATTPATWPSSHPQDLPETST